MLHVKKNVSEFLSRSPAMVTFNGSRGLRSLSSNVVTHWWYVNREIRCCFVCVFCFFCILEHVFCVTIHLVFSVSLFSLEPDWGSDMSAGSLCVSGGLSRCRADLTQKQFKNCKDSGRHRHTMTYIFLHTVFVQKPVPCSWCCLRMPLCHSCLLIEITTVNIPTIEMRQYDYLLYSIYCTYVYYVHWIRINQM